MKDHPFYNMSLADNFTLIKDGNNLMQKNINEIGIIQKTKHLLKKELHQKRQDEIDAGRNDILD